MPRRTDTRARMLETAAELFHTQGYHATGLNQLVSASGAPKGSLYFHFPGGKEQLAAEALELSAARMCEALQTVLAAADGPGAAVEAAVDLLAQLLVATDFRGGCPLATVAMDAAAGSEPIRQACVDGYGSWTTAIEETLTRSGAAPETAQRLATVALAGIEGALLLARTRRDVTPLRDIGDHLRKTMEAEVG